MEKSLRARQVEVVKKEMERSMLMIKKQEILAMEAAKEKLVNDFMAFIEAVENNNVENAQNFDEKAMVSTITTMMNSDGRDIGGSSGNFN